MDFGSLETTAAKVTRVFETMHAHFTSDSFVP
jgi:hypothetical protein